MVDYIDLLGRPTQDRVTELGEEVDAAVRRIATTYEVRGMVEHLTSYDNATAGSGSVVNDVQFTYDNFAQLAVDYQAHAGAVNTSTSPRVEYDYADGSANTIRPTMLTYPNGRVLNYNYGTTDGTADALSRVEALIDDDDTTHLADYSYLGLGTFVVTDYAVPQIQYTLVGTVGGIDPATGDIYRGLDRFGRIKDSYWYDYDNTLDVDRIKYGYDRNSNRTYRENTVAAAADEFFDEKYFNDTLDRLKKMDRGRLNAQRDGVIDKTFAQCWALDATGNWRKFLEDSNGDGDWSLDQLRTSNKVNEITTLTSYTGASWQTPAYNRAGNMAILPQPATPTASYLATYDAWNRLVKLEDDSDTIAEYAYDGAKRRTIQLTYTSGVLSETRHLYYTEPDQWQVIEERLGTSPDSADAERQFVWGQRYIDDLVLRDRDTDANGSLDERLFSLQDANWNVTSLTNASATVQERFNYNAYGTAQNLASNWTPTTDSFQWETKYAGYRLETSTQLYHVRNRVYNTTIGTWVQRDPLGIVSGMNAYVYVNAHPFSGVDPQGLYLVVIVVVGIIIVGGGIYYITTKYPVPKVPAGCPDIPPITNAANCELYCQLASMTAPDFANCKLLCQAMQRAGSYSCKSMIRAARRAVDAASPPAKRRVMEVGLSMCQAMGCNNDDCLTITGGIIPSMGG